ncbi:hypothetical protein LQG66_16995 [Bradyrhizobium ontarionense]|uniref:Uncharacterized protein n=1 Tax=Bradyrhizobium ontarionense TaxID=2898149 RepID=A0ABY3RQ02_9BRAD|nr:hypothetical protein [Bradyrhizobium sp. A19]UFZ08663.1 hypothetical protein LQG66_16995 [Bradyrhizobium sp. A19]
MRQTHGVAEGLAKQRMIVDDQKARHFRLSLVASTLRVIRQTLTAGIGLLQFAVSDDCTVIRNE